jgi:iron complex transport system ATP-binding protein
VIRVHAISHAYDRTPTLEEVDIEVATGQVTALVGPNGSGKSTLLRCAAGVLRPDRGRVTLAGRPVDDWSPVRRARLLAYLPQHVVPAFPVTARQMVAWGRHPYRPGWMTRDTHGLTVVAACLRRMEIEPLADRLFTTLSGGEARRCLIASCLAQEPGYLLLDEPTGDLDPPHGRALFRLLRELAEDGLAILVVTHDLNLAALFADRIVLLAGGRVLAGGAPDDVLQPALLTAAYGEGLIVGSHPMVHRPTVLALP